jgi:hypothetical protein
MFETEYTHDKSNYGSIGRGFINNYEGEGYQKTVALDMSNPDFFKDTYAEEIVGPGWTDQNSGAVMIVVEF